jgi:hypothetical protein
MAGQAVVEVENYSMAGQAVGEVENCEIVDEGG